MQNILEVLQIAKNTCTVLKDAPYCDTAQLNSLASRYAALVPQIDDTLRKHSEHIIEKERDSSSDYVIQLEKDVLDTAQKLSVSAKEQSREDPTSK